MRLFVVSLLVAVFFAGTRAIALQKAVIITYPDDTPQPIMDKAMEAIQDAGGDITHKFSLLKGFAAKSPSAALEVVKALGEKYHPVIEDDSVVTVDGSVAEGRCIGATC